MSLGSRFRQPGRHLLPRQSIFKGGAGPRHPRWMLFGVGLLLSLVLVFPRAIAGLAQTVSPELSPPPAEEPVPAESTTEAEETFSLPAIRNILTSNGGGLETAPVRLDGLTVFRVATAGGVSAQDRAAEIGQRLRELASRGFEAEQGWTVAWEEDPESAQPIILVNDAFLMTVTDGDAQSRGLPNARLRAEDLVSRIEVALNRYQLERQPAYLSRRVRDALLGAAGIILASVGLWVWQRRLRSHKQRLQAAADAEATATPGAAPNLRQQIARQQTLNLISLQQWASRILQGAVWGGGLFLLLGLFPHTRRWQPSLLQVLQVPLKIVGIILGVYGLIRLSNILVDRLFLVLQEDAVPVSLRSQRLTLRFSTVSRVVKNILGLLWGVIGLLSILAILGFDLGPILAGAGIIGLALSLASQNVLKDMINGFLILFEDQYGVGDIIIVGSAAGLVENMNLRITQLRNTAGHLITIPNGQIDVVENLSKEWARVDLSIPIALEADLDQALQLIQSVATSLSQDPLWKSNILEPPQMLGVDELGVGGATVRIWIKTQPLKQFDVGREFRHRLKLAFDEAGIPLGVPQQSLVMQKAQHSTQSHVVSTQAD